MRDALRESDQLAIGTRDDNAEPIVRVLGEGVAPLPLTNCAGGAGTAVRLDERSHMELGQGRHVDGVGSTKLKVAGDHVGGGSSQIIHVCVKTCADRRRVGVSGRVTHRSNPLVWVDVRGCWTLARRMEATSASFQQRRLPAVPHRNADGEMADRSFLRAIFGIEFPHAIRAYSMREFRLRMVL